MEALPGREGWTAGSNVLGVIITIGLHCVEELSLSSEEQEQWDGKINVCVVVPAPANVCLWTCLSD